MKLMEALEILKPVSAEKARFEVNLACGFTPLHFQTFLNAHLQTRLPNHRVEIKTGLFADLAGNIERLASARTESLAVAIEWSDLDPRLGLRRLGGWNPVQLPDIIHSAADQARGLSDSLERAAQSNTIALSLPTLPLPPVAFAPGWRSSAFDSELEEATAKLAMRLVKSAGIRMINQQRLNVLSPHGTRLDVKSDLNSGFPYTLSHADALADLFAQLIWNPPPRKGLITDLDDTLWKGILGEVSVDGIAWDLDHHAQTHGLYQQLLASLAEAGILIAVASKNDPELAEEAFHHANPILTRKQIFPLEANWGPKSGSVSRILNAWNISADNVVFVDDSPLDLAEVKAAFPEIECRLFPRDDDRAAYKLLEDLRDLFGKQSISAEDQIRRESLRASDAIKEMRSLEISPERFLQEAGGKLTLSSVKNPKDARALELINKTNQFNLNGKRLTESSWLEYLGDPRVFLVLASYQDKFGPLGKIAVITGRSSREGISVDYWVMSCRAFSRRIEHACILHLFRMLPVEEIGFDFAPTPRNGPLKTFFSELTGMAPTGPFSISRKQFLDRCPMVYLQIQEHSNE